MEFLSHLVGETNHRFLGESRLVESSQSGSNAYRRLTQEIPSIDPREYRRLTQAIPSIDPRNTEG